MGIYLTKPNTEKKTEQGENKTIRWTATGMQGIILKKVGELKWRIRILLMTIFPMA